MLEIAPSHDVGNYYNLINKITQQHELIVLEDEEEQDSYNI
jgi:hypothetical protein